MQVTISRPKDITTTHQQPRWRSYRLDTRWTSLILPVLIALLVVIPLFTLVMELIPPSLDLWRRQWQNDTLPRMIEATLGLLIGVGVGTLIVGVGAAWLVTAYDFPGRRWFDRLLLLPLAVPTFVMGFVFMAIFDFSGPVQSQLRVWFGTSDWFPQIRSLGGAIVVMTLVLYPYVYLLARAAFREQAAATFEASRVMGLSRTRTFFRLVLPMARPSIAAGAVLAMMEAMTDYGAVSFFSVPTLSEGIVRIWDVFYDRQTATELASFLLLFALGMIFLERALRGRAKYYQAGARGRRFERVPLTGWGRYAATGVLSTLLFAAFVLPLMQLIAWVIEEVNSPSPVGDWQAAFMPQVSTSVGLSLVTAGMVCLLALIVAYGVRANSIMGERKLPKFIARLVTLGYAMPGAVIAAGVLFFVAPIDHRITDFAEAHLGRTDPTLLISGTMMLLLYAYVVRFMAVGFNSVESSMEKITPNMEHAARTLGAKPWRVLWRVHFPLVSTGAAAGAVLVFVDVMKEIPATMMLRPFGLDTLALSTYNLAHEAFWTAAAIPALTILAVGLIPVLILMRIGDNGYKH